ncbi:MAG: c-type cytochrome [Bdellovibrionaceae bacterium]|jgi:cytochrome c553|nr:c-type cytochrome [Pseudobdellovibrionaceae bacterium]
MKQILIISILLSAISAFAAKPNLAREFFTERCNSCHGAVSTDLDSPVLYGQKKEYIVKQLQDFQSGERNDHIMLGEMNEIAKTLTDKEVDLVSTYLSNLSPCDYPPKDSGFAGDVKAGERISQSCKKCHHAWIPGLEVPTLYGQKPNYIYKTLNAFKLNKRKNSDEMGHQVKTISETDVRNVSAFYGVNMRCTIDDF